MLSVFEHVVPANATVVKVALKPCAPNLAGALGRLPDPVAERIHMSWPTCCWLQ